MKEIRREYLNDLIKLLNTPDIKVVTGIRRCGKTILLRQLAKHIEENIENSNLIYIDYSDLDTINNLSDYNLLNKFILNSINPNKKNYLIIDEVQTCENFSLVLNSLHSKQIVDIYISGSNGYLLSDDISTLLSGRTYKFHIYPFSYKEYMEYFDLPLIEFDRYFEKYLSIGGMSGSYVYSNEINLYNNYIKNLFNDITIKDILKRFNIKNRVLLEKIISYMISETGNLISPNKISNFLKKEYPKVNNVTVSKYIDAIKKSFAFYEINRYDVVGKKYLEHSSKYYLSDISFLNSTKEKDIANLKGRILETIVALELLRRGYSLYAGILYDKEVDFIALKEGKQTCLQVCLDISNENTLKRELEPLYKIKGGFEKILITRNHELPYYIDGIKIIDISDWLINS